MVECIVDVAFEMGLDVRVEGRSLGFCLKCWMVVRMIVLMCLIMPFWREFDEHYISGSRGYVWFASEA